MELKRIGENVVSLREAKRWSQDTLVAKSGVARGALQRLELGQGNPTYRTLRNVAGALDVSMADLIGSEGLSLLKEILATVSALHHDQLGPALMNLKAIGSAPSKSALKKPKGVS